MITKPPSAVRHLQPRLLLGPGPSPVSQRIRDAMALPTVGHLDPGFLQVMDEVSAGLRAAFGTNNPSTFALSATGSAGMEASLANVIEPGDIAVIGICGVFGTRLAEMARRMGAQVVTVEAPWGQPLDPDDVLSTLRQHPRARVLALVHAETSTGVRQPLVEIGRAVSETDTLLVVDTVTSLAGMPVEVDAIGIDIAYSGTQKCLGVPPGLSPISISEKALARINGRTVPCQSWYLDAALIGGYLGAERRYHHTAPINMIYALHEGLAVVEEEGLDVRYRRHERVGGALQAGLLDRGFELFAADGFRLPQLTSMRLPGGVAEEPPRRALLERFGIEVGGGLGPVAGKIWRVGLMGSGATMDNVETLLDAIDTLHSESPW